VPAEPLTKDESKLALAIVAGFVVLALVIGIWGVSRIGSHTDLGGSAAPATRTTTVAPSSAAPSESGATPTKGGSDTAEPLAILKVEAYDPEGDGAENNKLTPKTYDGDTSTGWFSENYRSDEFGGLKKGLGVIVDLGPNKKPQGVELTIPVAADIEVYVGPDNRLEGATKIAEEKDAKGTVKVDVPGDVGGQYIVVWYTKLTADDNGKRRAWLNEVVVTG
jgi:eukaryotic-like serine/threonine-protein kinase